MGKKVAMLPKSRSFEFDESVTMRRIMKLRDQLDFEFVWDDERKKKTAELDVNRRKLNALYATKYSNQGPEIVELN